MRAVKKAKLPAIRLHDLRHSHATLALRAGIHPKVVSERLGHATVAITLDTYSHAIPALQEEAAAQDRGARLWRQVGQAECRRMSANVGANVGIGARERIGPEKVARVQESLLEAATGVEPVIKVLQTSALPLGYAASGEALVRRAPALLSRPASRSLSHERQSDRAPCSRPLPLW